MHKFIIMGPQGSGKGTQAKMLCHELDLTHFSVGDILRWNVQAHTKLGARVRRIMAQGELVSDEIVESIIDRRLEQHDWNYGFLLDGFPRNPEQAQFFLESYDIDAVLYLDVPDEVTIERALARRVCASCGLDYNLIFHRPEDPELCDVCGGRLVAREDDKADVLQNRLNDFHSKTKPTLELFERKELVLRFDGTHDRKQVFDDILTAIKRL